MERDRGTVGGCFSVTVEDSFSAAHALTGYGGDCERLHGHNWIVRATVSSYNLDKMGIVIDFRELKKMLREALEDLDHHNLTEHQYFSKVNPSAENIAKYIFDSLHKGILEHGCRLEKVEISETPNTTALYQE